MPPFLPLSQPVQPLFQLHVLPQHCVAWSQYRPSGGWQPQVSLGFGHGPSPKLRGALTAKVAAAPKNATMPRSRNFLRLLFRATPSAARSVSVIARSFPCLCVSEERGVRAPRGIG
jgi:hypothetical protein